MQCNLEYTYRSKHYTNDSEQDCWDIMNLFYKFIYKQFTKPDVIKPEIIMESPEAGDGRVI